jgi:hypothetical protein
MRGLGWMLLGVGLVWLAYAVTLDTSVEVFGGYGGPARVLNLSLAENKRMHLMLSIGTILASIMLVGFSQFQRRTDDDVEGEEDELRQCPYCAETIRIEAVICKHCRKELPAVNLESSQSTEDAIEEEIQEEVDDQVSDGPTSYRELRDAVESAEKSSQQQMQ